MQMQALFPHRPARSRLMALLLIGAAIAAPVSIDFTPGKLPVLSPALAHARGGDDNGGGHGRGGDDSGGGHGRGGDDNGGGRGGGGGDNGGGRGRGGDDSGGGHGRGGQDGPGDDHGGHGRGRDDGPGDDHGGRGRGRGADDGAQGAERGRGRGRDDSRRSPDHHGGIGRPSGGAPTRHERSARGIEVTYADGWREELENGRYELKDARNRTVVERPATRQDYDRLGAMAR